MSDPIGKFPKINSSFIWLSIILPLILMASTCRLSPTLDEQLQAVIREQGITRLDPGAAQDLALVVLGQALYFDKILSGNRDIACATCHHPQENSGDDLPVSIGTGGVGLGETRQIGYGRSLHPSQRPRTFQPGRRRVADHVLGQPGDGWRMGTAVAIHP